MSNRRSIFSPPSYLSDDVAACNARRDTLNHHGNSDRWIVALTSIVDAGMAGQGRYCVTMLPARSKVTAAILGR